MFPLFLATQTVYLHVIKAYSDTTGHLSSDSNVSRRASLVYRSAYSNICLEVICDCTEIAGYRNCNISTSSSSKWLLLHQRSVSKQKQMNKYINLRTPASLLVLVGRWSYSPVVNLAQLERLSVGQSHSHSHFHSSLSFTE